MAITVSVIETPPDVIDDSFTVATNEDWQREYQISKDGVPLRIEASWKIYSQWVAPDGVVVVNASTDNRRLVVTDSDAGKFALQIKAAESSQVTPALVEYDIVLVAGDGIYRLVRGSVTIDQGITNVPGQQGWTHVPLISRP